MIGRLYARWIGRWENKLASLDSNRLVRPFDWGLEWLDGRHPGEYARAALADSDRFFSYSIPRDYSLKDGMLTFTSPALSPHPENNTVHARFFPCPPGGDRAVLVLPQWNAAADGHIALCRLLNRFGLSALRMSMAYHDYRMPRELERADYAVSSNIGRTVHAGRQTILDARACLDWLESRGYGRLAVLGTSLGSCMAFIMAAHDSRIRAAAFNHVSMYFGDVVWTGMATRHVRRGLEANVTQDELRDYWSVISPASYLDRMAARRIKTLLIWARYDTTFLPEFSRSLLAEYRNRGLPFECVSLPCAHYTTGRFPFVWMDGLALCRFLARSM